MKHFDVKRMVFFVLIGFAHTVYAQQWSELGGTNGLSANDLIRSICSDASGNIYAAGNFTKGSSWTANGTRYIAQYDGTKWSELGGSNASLAEKPGANYIYSDASGNIYVAGLSNSYNELYLAKYNGSNWSELGGDNSLPESYGILYSICSDASGNIYTGGAFDYTNNINYVFKYNGSSWSKPGGSNTLTANNTIVAICSDALANIYAGGYFTNGSNATSGKKYVAKYNGSSWSELGGKNALAANDLIHSICCDASGNIYAAGSFTNSSGKKYVAKYDGTKWSELGGTNALAANGNIQSICSDASGNIYTAGSFTNSNGKYYVAKYDGTKWSELGGTNALAANGDILSICSDASENIYVAGSFTNSNGKHYVAAYTHKETTTGISLENKDDAIHVFPNATHQIVVNNNLRKGGTEQVTVYNFAGQQIINENAIADTPYETKSLNRGIYLTVVRFDGKCKSFKVLIE